MKTFTIEVTETSSRLVKVQASDSESAVKLVKEMYDNQDIILDYTDFNNIEFTDVTQ